MIPLPPARLRAGDLLRLGAHGLRARPLRTALSALGIAIGIAAMLAVLGTSASGQANVQRQLDALGTNLLTVTAGQTGAGNAGALPTTAAASVANVPGVEQVAWTADLKDVAVYRNALVPEGATGGLVVATGGGDLLGTTGTPLRSGRWFDAATDGLDTVVLGDAAATHLGVREPGVRIQVGGREFTVIGILGRSALVPDLDLRVFTGEATATTGFRYEGRPTAVYERSDDDLVDAVRQALPRTVAPDRPSSVAVSRPSDALAAKNVVDGTSTALLVGVGSIALVVGGIGVANTMVISVLERRVEIGLRRSLGATRRHITRQFVVEAILLAAVGGALGTLAGAGITVGVAVAQDWPPTLPPLAIAAGVLATIVVGAIAGALPAVRAARIPPTVVMRS